MQAPDGGGGGGGFISSVSSGMDSLGQQMADFAASAKSGQFSVNDQGGKALMGAIQDMQQWLNTVFMDMQNRGLQGKKYGTTHAAAVVEPYMDSVMDDADGLLPTLEKFQDVLNDAKEAITKAMENYKWSDAEAKQGLPEAGGDVSLSPGGPRATPIPYTPTVDGGPRVQSV